MAGNHRSTDLTMSSQTAFKYLEKRVSVAIWLKYHIACLPPHSLCGTFLVWLMADALVGALGLGFRRALAEQDVTWALMLLSHTVITMTCFVLVLALLGARFFKDGVGLGVANGGGGPPPPPPPPFRVHLARLAAPPVMLNSDDSDTDDSSHDERELLLWSFDGVLWTDTDIPVCIIGRDMHKWNNRGSNLYYDRGKCIHCGVFFKQRK